MLKFLGLYKEEIRTYMYSQIICLHTFVDASESAYGAVVYSYMLTCLNIHLYRKATSL